MKKLLILLLIFNFVSCSSKKKKEVPKKKVKKAAPLLVSGPTRPTINTDFYDTSSKYGLEGVKATHLYSVNLNNDYYNDLVVLPSYYSIPEFFIFDPSEQKFIKMKTYPFAQN